VADGKFFCEPFSCNVYQGNYSFNRDDIWSIVITWSYKIIFLQHQTEVSHL